MNEKSEKNVFRFAVGNSAACSEIWTIVFQKSDVYLIANTQKGAIKVSLHGSGVCHYSMLQEFFNRMRPIFDQDIDQRTILRWKRGKTPSHRARVAFRLVFAADGKWPNADRQPPAKKTRLLRPPPEGYQLEVVFTYSKQDPRRILDPFSLQNEVLWIHQLENQDFLTIFYHQEASKQNLFERRELPSEKGFISFGFELEKDQLEVDDLSMHYIQQEYEGMATVYSLHNVILSLN